MSHLIARGVTVSLGGVRVVDGVDLEVVPGAWVALLGPNGAGKTTLLKALTGLVPHGGTLTLDGVDPRTLSRRELARCIAVVPQSPIVPVGMSVLEYVLLGRTPYIAYLGVESANDVAIATALLERLDLTGFEDRTLDSLSGGELQRSVLARALAQQAPLLLLDEPTSSLDIGHQQQVLELVDTLRREDGLTVVTAIHDLTTAGQYADRLVLLDHGRVVAEGPPREVLTAETVQRHYRADVEILAGPDGTVAVVPRRPTRGDPGAGNGAAED